MSALNIVTLTGSLRRDSYSAAVMQALVKQLPADANVTELKLRDYPLYDGDLEAEALPEVVVAERCAVANADAVLITLPEYNHGVPGMLKNALDWLSRPHNQSCFKGKPVFFVTQSLGALGGVRAQYQLRETLSSMLAKPAILPEMAIPFVGEKIENGQLTDERTLTFIGAQLTAFLATL